MERTEPMNNCNQILRAQGKAYPRTCAKCGWGPCHRELEKSNAPPQPAHGEPKSAHDQIPSEHKASIQNLLYHPKFLARLLLEESEGAEGWAKAHADGTSVTEEGGKWISKRDAYAQKAKRFRDAAHSLNPDLSAVEVHSKETMDEVREALKRAGGYAHMVGASTTCAVCFSAFAKLNPPQ